MSNKALNWAWRQDLKPVAKIVLVCLADHANESNHCWPSLRRIETRTGAAYSTVSRILNKLEAANLIRRQRSNGRINTKYQLLIGNHQQSDSETVEPSYSGTVTGPNSPIARAQQSDSESPTVRPSDTNHHRTLKEPIGAPPKGAHPIGDSANSKNEAALGGSFSSRSEDQKKKASCGIQDARKAIEVKS